jgi:peroxiredoxin Q/BCP
LVAEGAPAPDFELESDSGETVRLSDFRGRAVILYFYPKDDTPGCTTEACEFRDAYDVFRERNAEVGGGRPRPGSTAQK